MARQIKLTTKLSVAEVERRYRRTSEGMERSHWHHLAALAGVSGVRGGVDDWVLGVLDWAAGATVQ